MGRYTNIPGRLVGANICFDCARACGGCSWSRRFKPVPGWTAQRATLPGGTPGTTIDTYQVTACPKYVKTVRHSTQGRATPVIRTNPETGEEKRYASMSIAAHVLAGNPSRIYTACMNGQSYKGFLWRKEHDA